MVLKNFLSLLAVVQTNPFHAIVNPIEKKLRGAIADAMRLRVDLYVVGSGRGKTECFEHVG